MSKFFTSTLLLFTGLAVAVEMPYAPIATPGGESPDRRVADSLNTLISPIRVNQAGYLPGDTQKLIYVVGNATAFEVVKASDSSLVANGTLTSTGSTTASSIKIVANIDGTVNNNVLYSMSGTGPSGKLQKGTLPTGLPENTPLRIRVGSDYSADFIISEKVHTYARNATLRFFGLQQSKHTKDGMGPITPSGSGLTSKEGALAGGWYDCGDHLKESQTQAYAAAVLALMAATHSTKDQDEYDATQSDPSKPDGVPDMLAEAKHGADFVLAAYDFAQGEIDNMPVSIGNFGDDHNFWGTPAAQEALPASIQGRGGPHERDVRLGELGSNISSEFAANLAIVSKLYATRDAAYSAKCLQVAKELYEFAKKLALKQISPVNNTIAAGWSSPAYNGNNEYHDDLALAAIALLYATKDTLYLYDAVENPALAKGYTKANFTGNKSGAGAFRGGWFTAGDQPTLWKAVNNTSWANAYAFTLYGFYKMILQNADSAKTYGIKTETRRKEYIEDVALTMAANLGSMSVGSGAGSITMPQGVIGWAPSTVNYDPVWFNMFTSSNWIYNRNQVGNIFELLAYAEVAKDLEDMDLIYFKRGTAWKSKELRQLGIHQMDYLLGLNPWDVSFIYGIGDKNDMHPHHRQSNPEGRNPWRGLYDIPEYDYRVPVGALFGGKAPNATNDWTPSASSYEDYHLSEVCLDGSTTLLAGLTLLADTSKAHGSTSNIRERNAQTAPPLALKAQVTGAKLYLDAQLPRNQDVEVRLLTMGGRTLLHKVFVGQTGKNHWVFDLKELPAGLSAIRINTGSLQQSILLAH